MSLHYLVKHEWPKNQRSSPCSKNQRITTFCSQISCSVEARSTAWNARTIRFLHLPARYSTPAHRARPTVELMEREVPDFICPSLWPPNSPDLNPVDYKIWSLVQERMYQQPISNIDELREHIVAVWEAVDHARHRRSHTACSCESVFLLVRVKAKGGHFEHCLNKSGLVVILHIRHLWATETFIKIFDSRMLWFVVFLEHGEFRWFSCFTR